MPSIIHGTGGQLFIGGKPIDLSLDWEAGITPDLPVDPDWRGPYVACHSMTMTFNFVNLRALKRNNIMAKKIHRMARRMRAHLLN